MWFKRVGFLLLLAFISFSVMSAPLPFKDAYYEKLIPQAETRGEQILAATEGENVAGNCYYDGASSYLELSLNTVLTPSTGNNWYDYAIKCAEDYVNDRRDADGQEISCYGRGYIRFPRGLASIYLTNPEQTVVTSNSLECLRATGGGAFAGPWSYNMPWCQTCTNVIREISYSLETEVANERIGNGRREDDLRFYIEGIGSILWQVRMNTYIDHGRDNEEQYHFIQPFMAGLSTTSLIEYFQFMKDPLRNPLGAQDPNIYWVDPSDETKDWSTIELAIADIATWLYSEAIIYRGQGDHELIGESVWNSELKQFSYIDRCIFDEVGSSCNMEYTPDLNMLIIKMFAFSYKETQDIYFYNAAVEILEGSLNWYEDGSFGKQTNQQMRDAFDSFCWLEDKIACNGKCHP
jgi:hypothetical protein